MIGEIRKGVEIVRLKDAVQATALESWLFRALDLARLKGIMIQPVIVDLRNIYRAGEMRRGVPLGSDRPRQSGIAFNVGPGWLPAGFAPASGTLS